MACRADRMIELSSDETASLCTILNRTTAKATAATVPTAYSAVVMPRSLACSRTVLTRWVIRFRSFMSRTNPTQAPPACVRTRNVDEHLSWRQRDSLVDTPPDVPG